MILLYIYWGVIVLTASLLCRLKALAYAYICFTKRKEKRKKVAIVAKRVKKLHTKWQTVVMPLKARSVKDIFKRKALNAIVEEGEFWQVSIKSNVQSPRLYHD